MLIEKELIVVVADILRKERIRNNLTLEKLAEKSDTDYSTVNLILNAKQNTKVYTLYKLLYSMDIDIIELLNNKGNELKNKYSVAINKIEKLDEDSLDALLKFLDNFYLIKK